MIFGINTTRDISKLSQISLAWRRVKLRITILKYHLWYLCQISLQIMLLPILIWLASVPLLILHNQGPRSELYTTTSFCLKTIFIDCKFAWKWGQLGLYWTKEKAFKAIWRRNRGISDQNWTDECKNTQNINGSYMYVLKSIWKNRQSFQGSLRIGKLCHKLSKKCFEWIMKQLFGSVLVWGEELCRLISKAVIHAPWPSPCGQSADNSGLRARSA